MNDVIVKDDIVIENLIYEVRGKQVMLDSFNKFEEKKKFTEIYFNGQIYDAYSKIQEIFKSVTKKLVIIDVYAARYYKKIKKLKKFNLKKGNLTSTR